MAVEPIVGGRYRVTWQDLGSPRVKGDYEVPNLGWVVLDDADIHYATNNPDHAAFFIRKSAALGERHWVVVSRVQAA